MKKFGSGVPKFVDPPLIMSYNTGLRRTFTNFRHSSRSSGWVKEGATMKSMWQPPIFTARNEVGARLYFHRRL